MFARRTIPLLLALYTGPFVAAACGSDDGEPENTCEPGTNVFCRCPGGDAGTRECLSSGEDFGDCVIAPEVPCGDRVECEPYTTVFCLCPDGTEGLKECLREGTGYAECRQASGAACPLPTSDNGSSSSGMGGFAGTGGSGVGAGTTGCVHDVCSTGAPLSASCGMCEAAVCAADDYCCTNQWDGVCVGLADDECDNVCNPIGMCEHDVCMAGAALTSTCDPCVSSVCTQDSFCCDMANGTWDTTCVNIAKDGGVHPDCSGTCCAHSECTEGAKLEAGCSLCVDSVCGQDSYCCDNEWDGVCVDIAKAVPSCNCL